MNALESSEPVRRGGLELLACGNSVESVAHVFGVSVDVVQSWRDGPAEAPVDAPRPAPSAATVDAARARTTSSIHFDDTLDYSTSTGYRRMMFCVAMIVLGVALFFLAMMYRDGAKRPTDVALMINMALGLGAGIVPLLGLAKIGLVLDERDVVAPGLFRDARVPYSQVGGYSIEPGGLALGRGSDIAGETLRIRSLCPGVGPLEVFIDQRYPLDADIVRRLDDVSRANRARHVLPERTASIRRLNLGGVLFFGASLIVTLMMSMPMFREGLRTSRRVIPSMSTLQHREGRLTWATRCSRPEGRNSELSMTIRMGNAASAPPLLLPCVLDDSALMNGEPHRVAIDLDESGSAPDNVYQVELEGRSVLSDDTARARQQHDVQAAARFEVGASLAAIGVLGVLSFLMARRRFRAGAR